MKISHRTRTAAILAMAITVLAASALPVAGGGDPLHLTVTIGERCFSGRGVEDAIHVVSLRAADGVLRARDRVRSGDSGSLSGCFRAPNVVNPTDRVSIRAAGVKSSATVYDIRPLISRDRDTVKGRGRPGSEIEICVQDVPGPLGDTSICYDTTVAPDGRWLIDVSHQIDITGTNSVRVVTRHNGIRTMVSTSAPYVNVGPQTDLVTGRKRPHETATFRLIGPSGRTRATAIDSRTGNDFSASLQDEQGRPVYPRAGDRLIASIAGGLRLRIPHAALVADASDDLVRGRCMARSPYFVIVRLRDQFPNYIDGTTDAEGRFEAPGDGLPVGTRVEMFCSYPILDRLVMTTEVRP